MILRNIFLAAILLTFTNCSMFGWEGSFVNIDTYKKKESSSLQSNPEKEDERLELMRRVKLAMKNGKTEGVVLPTCSSFSIGGLFTPITPTIPFFWPRILAFNNDPCNYFGVRANQSVKIIIRYKDKFYEPIRYNPEKHLYIFPIQAKDIDSGSIIIEKDGEKVEVPFEYKYIKFWY